MKISFDSVFSECYDRSGTLFAIENQLALLELEDLHNREKRAEKYPIRISVSSLMLVVSGQMDISVDYRPYQVKQGMIMQLTMDNVIEKIAHSPDFKGYQLLFSPELKSEIMAQTSGVRLSKSNQLKRSFPILELHDVAYKDLLNRFECIKKYMLDENHLYRTAIIINEIINLHYEIDSLRRVVHGYEDVKTDRNEALREQFRELLLKKCKVHHDVHFYAEELCVTSDYLSRVIREYDGQSAMKWIVNAVITEAKIMLRLPSKTIGQIAIELNYPDQSTFGKFFKRHVGISPAEYRRELQYW